MRRGKTRLPREARWTGVMQRELGPAHFVIEEGLNGRTTVFNDPIETDRRGADYLRPCLLEPCPLDLLIIALGANDLKSRFSASPYDIAAGLERLIEIARAEKVSPQGKAPQVLIVAPPPIAKLSAYAEMFTGAVEKSRALPTKYAELAERLGVGYVEAGRFIRCRGPRRHHYEADQHAILGRVMAEAARLMLA